MNKRRLLDKFALVDVRIVVCDFKLHQTAVAMETTKANAQIRVSPHNNLVQSAPAGLKQVCESTLDVVLKVAPVDAPDDAFYDLTVKLLGLFSLVEGDSVSLEELSKEGHCFTRMLFPLARSEISRILARARVPDLPLAWDTGVQPLAQ